MPSTAPDWLHVAAGVIVGPEGQILIAERAKHRHQGGLWEFPGGKVEPGETVQQALARELWEELNIHVGHARPLIQIRHRYPDKSVLLDVWRVESFTGEPHGREGQPLAWVCPEALVQYAFPAANVPIVTAARLPAVLPVQSAGECVRLDLPSGGLVGRRSGFGGVLPEADFLVVPIATEGDWAAFARLCEAALVPVYAEGVSLAMLARVWDSGGQGIVEPA